VGRDFLGMARTDVTVLYQVTYRAQVLSCVAGWHVKVDLAVRCLLSPDCAKELRVPLEPVLKWMCNSKWSQWRGLLSTWQIWRLEDCDTRDLRGNHSDLCDHPCPAHEICNPTHYPLCISPGLFCLI